MNTIFKGTVEIKDIRFFKDGFGIVRSEVIEEKQGVLQPCGHKDKADKKNMVLKGVMPKPEKGQQYIIEADFEYNEMKSRAENVLTSYLRAINDGKTSKNCCLIV